MLTLYFSGTGNSQYIARRFSELMQSECHSIEENLDFESLISNESTIAVCYPIYGSCVPEIMRDFIKLRKSCFTGKKLIIFCTQLLFSGDGARVFTELLTDINTNIIYAEHFNMPNNISNLFIFPMASQKKIKKYIKKADYKLEIICRNIRSGIIKKRGFSVFSKYLGLIAQRFYFRKFETKAKKDVRINNDCNLCSRCTSICPTDNLELISNRIIQKEKCTLCYRCVNICPQKAITVFLHAKVIKQYKGIT